MCQEFFEAVFGTLCDAAYWVVDKVNVLLRLVARSEDRRSGG